MSYQKAAHDKRASLDGIDSKCQVGSRLGLCSGCKGRNEKTGGPEKLLADNIQAIGTAENSI